MTVNDVISEIDELRPNKFSFETKTRWISECECEILIRTGKTAVKLSYPADAGAELSVPHPFDKIYVAYLEAAIDYRTKDYAAYQNSSAVYNEALIDYMKYYERSKSSAWKEMTEHGG